MRRLIPMLLNLAALAAVGGAVLGRVPYWAAAVAVVGWWVLSGPAVVYATPGLPLTLADLEVIPDGVPTNPASDQWAREIAARFAPHGFIARARYRLRGPQQPFDFAQRFDNPITGEVATIMAGWQAPPDGAAPTPVRLVGFHTRVRDEGEVLTSNSHLPSITPPLPGQRAYRLPEIKDPAALYSVHRKLVKQDGRKPVPFVLGDDPLAWERKQHERSIAIQVKKGLAVRDEKAGRLRLTVKGALRTTWLLHPFLTRFQDRRATKEASAALRTLPA